MALDLRERKISVFATKTKYRTGSPFFLTPMWDSVQNRYLYGWEDLNQSKQKEFLAFLGIKKDDDVENVQVPLTHGRILDLSQTLDQVVFCLCHISPQIATTRKQVTFDHEFFLLDQEVEDQVDVSTELLRLDAKMAIRENGDMVKLKQLAVFLGGIDIARLSQTSLQSRLYKEADIRPKDIIHFFEKVDPIELMVKELAYYSVITNRMGVYYDGDIRLGTFRESVEFLNDPKNNEQANSLGRRLTEEKNRK